MLIGAGLAFGVLTPVAAGAKTSSDGAPIPQAAIDLQKVRDEPGANPGPLAEEDRVAVLGEDWASSDDFSIQGIGSADAFHLIRADSAEGYAWHTLASLTVEGVETDAWIGNFCLVAGGKKAAVVYAPRAVTNDPMLFDAGAFAAIVDLGTGAVTELGPGFTIAHFNPGCGEADLVTFTGYVDGQTNIGIYDSASGGDPRILTSEAELTSPVPAADGRVYAARADAIVAITSDGQDTPAVETTSAAFDLTITDNGSLTYVDHDFETASVKLIEDTQTIDSSTSTGPIEIATAPVTELGLARSADGTVYVTGDYTQKNEPPPGMELAEGTSGDSRISSEGLVATSQPSVPLVSADSEVTAEGMEAVVTTSSLTTGTQKLQSADLILQSNTTEAFGPAVAAPSARTANAKAAWTTGTISDTERSCAIPRSDPRYQAYQPEPRQVEWAVNRAVEGTMTTQRPANWMNMGMGAYRPGTMFPKTALAGGGSVPSAVMMGILMQESNIWQASRYTNPGLAGNPLIGFYYGTTRDQGTNTSVFWHVDWDNTDCGYGVGQVTDGMRMPAHTDPDGPPAMSFDKQRAVALDYAANVARSVQILTEKWNQTYSAGVKVHNANPARLENWFFALWAYNTGFYPEGENGSRWGVGWYNNPANPRFDPSRPPFLQESSADAASPQRWPYQEKVLGFAAYPPAVVQSQFIDSDNGDVTKTILADAFRAAYWNGGASLGDLRRSQVKPPSDLFCSADIGCNPVGARYNCSMPASECWWHEPVSWKNNCDVECGISQFRYPAPKYQAEQEPLDYSYPPACTRAGLPANARIVDNVPIKDGTNGVINVGPVTPKCSRVNTVGSFEFDFGSKINNYEAAKIDLHQLGGGFNGHFWFSHLRDPQTNIVAPIMTGRWNLGSSLNQWGRVWVHMPDHGAWSQNAQYKVNLGDGSSETRSLLQRNYDNIWLPLGAFEFNGSPSVELSNLDPAGSRLTDLAWDAVAFEPLPGKPNDIVVSLGDSFSSGEGAQPYYRSSDNNGATVEENAANKFQNACHRSKFAWSREMVIGSDSRSVGARANALDVNLDHHLIACSGAEVINMVHGGDGQWAQLPQLDQGYLNADTTLVTMTIGGNDVGFADVITSCIMHSLTNPSCETEKPAAYQRLEQLKSDLRELLGQIHDRAPNATIAIGSYPDLFAQHGACVGVRPDALPWLQQMADDLAEGIALTSLEFGQDSGADVLYVDPRLEFSGRNLCSEMVTGLPSSLNSFVLNNITPGEDPNGIIGFAVGEWSGATISQQSIHPNRDGTARYGQAFTRVLDQGY